MLSSAVHHLLPRSSTNKQTNILTHGYNYPPWDFGEDFRRSCIQALKALSGICGSLVKKKTGACWKIFLYQRLHRLQSLTSVFVQVLDMLSFCRYPSLSLTPFPKWVPWLTHLAGGTVSPLFKLKTHCCQHWNGYDNIGVFFSFLGLSPLHIVVFRALLVWTECKDRLFHWPNVSYRIYLLFAARTKPLLRLTEQLVTANVYKGGWQEHWEMQPRDTNKCAWQDSRHCSVLQEKSQTLPTAIPWASPRQIHL